MIKKRNTTARDLVQRPIENFHRLNPEELQKLLDEISKLADEDLSIILSAISNGLIVQRNAAKDRAIDMELAVANVALRPATTPKQWRFILDEFLIPHQHSLRQSWIIESLEKRASKRINENEEEK